MIVEKTRSGIIIRPWNARVISYWEDLRIQAGVSSEGRREKGGRCKGIEYEPDILDKISRI